jgi:hypothetical protein
MSITITVVSSVVKTVKKTNGLDRTRVTVLVSMAGSTFTGPRIKKETLMCRDANETKKQPETCAVLCRGKNRQCRHALSVETSFEIRPLRYAGSIHARKCS